MCKSLCPLKPFEPQLGTGKGKEISVYAYKNICETINKLHLKEGRKLGLTIDRLNQLSGFKCI